MLNILYSIMNGIAQGWTNFLRGGPHFKKMLQPRAAHSHYKVGKFIQSANNHIFILQKIFIFLTRYVYCYLYSYS